MRAGRKPRPPFGRCLRAMRLAARLEATGQQKYVGPRGPISADFPGVCLERAKGFEPSTPTLARSCSTPELHPHPLGSRPSGRQTRSYAKRRGALQPQQKARVAKWRFGARPLHCRARAGASACTHVLTRTRMQREKCGRAVPQRSLPPCGGGTGRGVQPALRLFSIRCRAKAAPRLLISGILR